jgi:hypothetical protein
VNVPEKPGKRVPAIFFRTEGGGEPVRDWLKATLSAEDRKRVGHDIMTVEYGRPVHGFIKKTGRTPAEELSLARGNKKKHEKGLP